MTSIEIDGLAWKWTARSGEELYDFDLDRDASDATALAEYDAMSDKDQTYAWNRAQEQAWEAAYDDDEWDRADSKLESQLTRREL